MVQYEKVNGIPKLVPSGDAPPVKETSYVDEAGNKQVMSDPGDFMGLIKRLTGKSKKPKDLAELNKLLGINPDMPVPKKKLLSTSISLGFPQLTYHQRYMRDLTTIVAQYFSDRLQRKAGLMAGVKQLKAHVDAGSAN